MSEVLIDGRELSPPEPFVRVQAALATLPREGQVKLLLPREPFPLYEALRRAGFVWSTVLEASGTYVITIRHGP